MVPVLVFLLLPFSWIYASVMAVRNWLYEVGIQTSARFPVPLISVGNLRVGGTGKTPHVAWVVRELQKLAEHPAIVSRGYGRRTKGYRAVSANSTAAEVGDEPLQHFLDFHGLVPVVVSEDRRVGLAHLLTEQQPSVILLDDAFQHRRVQPTLSILLMEQQRPFYEDFVLPAGRLRENRAGAGRADVVIVTKCSEQLSEVEQQAMRQRIRQYGRPAVPVFFSYYAYGEPKRVGDAGRPPGKEIVLLTGIAQPEPLRSFLVEAGYTVVRHAAFSDHHLFSPAEIQALCAQLRPGQSIFTTQKDAMRLREPAIQGLLHQVPVFYIPIEVRFLADGANQLRSLLMSTFQPQAVV